MSRSYGKRPGSLTFYDKQLYGVDILLLLKVVHLPPRQEDQFEDSLIQTFEVDLGDSSPVQRRRQLQARR